ncbi:MAG: hypothetical protein ACRDTA_20550 [Pseudonocardiaceae bacterium]
MTANLTPERIEKITTPTPVRRRAFELLGATVLVTLQQPVTTRVSSPDRP